MVGDEGCFEAIDCRCDDVVHRGRKAQQVFLRQQGEFLDPDASPFPVLQPLGGS